MSFSKVPPMGTPNYNRHWKPHTPQYPATSRYHGSQSHGQRHSNPAAVKTTADTVWSTNDASNYSAVYGAEASSNIRQVKGSRSGQQTGNSQSKGIKGRDFGSAFIGKEAEQYVQDDLRNELNSSLLPPLSGDPIAPSPSSVSNFTPRIIVEEFKRANHFDTTRKQLLLTFQSSEYKEELLQSLRKYLMQRLSTMAPEERQRLASQDNRMQSLTLTRWIEESSEAADVIDGLMAKMRGKQDDENSLFNKGGAVGKELNNRLAEVVQAEKRRAERKSDSSDEDGGDSTPLNKGGSATPAQDVSTRGSQTPMAAAIVDSVMVDASYHSEKQEETVEGIAKQ